MEGRQDFRIEGRLVGRLVGRKTWWTEGQKQFFNFLLTIHFLSSIYAAIILKVSSNSTFSSPLEHKPSTTCQAFLSITISCSSFHVLHIKFTFVSNSLSRVLLGISLGDRGVSATETPYTFFPHCAIILAQEEPPITLLAELSFFPSLSLFMDGWIVG